MTRTCILYIFLGIILVGAIVLGVFLRQNRMAVPEKTNGGEVNEETSRFPLEVVGEDEMNVDSVSVEDLGSESRVTNETHNYAITAPNSWKLEVQKNAIKLYPREETSGATCLMNTVVIDNSEGLTPDELIAEDNETSIISEFENGGTVQVGGGVVGTRRLEKVDGEVVAESVLVPHNNSFYILTSYYNQIEGVGSDLDNQSVCEPLFDELIRSFDFAD